MHKFSIFCGGCDSSVLKMSRPYTRRSICLLLTRGDSRRRDFNLCFQICKMCFTLTCCVKMFARFTTKHKMEIEKGV